MKSLSEIKVGDVFWFDPVDVYVALSALKNDVMIVFVNDRVHELGIDRNPHTNFIRIHICD